MLNVVFSQFMLSFLTRAVIRQFTLDLLSKNQSTASVLHSFDATHAFESKAGYYGVLMLEGAVEQYCLNLGAT